MKKLLCAVLALAMMMTACLAMAETVEEVIAQAQTMTNEELYAKAIEESNGKTLYGIGNSSRGKTAGASFIEMLQRSTRATPARSNGRSRRTTPSSPR